MKRGKINWKTFIFSLLIVYAVAFAGSLFTDADSSWYESVKPSITPPNYVFPIVWNILFFMISLSIYFVWIDFKNKERKKILIFFGINLFLNFLWSIFFFGIHHPKLAFADLILLEIFTIIIFKKTYSKNKTSFYLLVPYLIWLAFAGILNYLIAFH